MKVESIQVIPPLSRDLVEFTTRSLLGQLARGSAKKVDRYRDMDIWQTGNDDAGAYLLYDEKANSIPYFARFQHVKRPPLRFGRQILINREPLPQTVGISAYVFFQILLPKFGSLISDTEQTTAGQRFWTYAVYQAFQKKLFVYVLDERGSAPQLTRMSDSKQVGDAGVWGPDESYQGILLIISTTELAL